MQPRIAVRIKRYDPDKIHLLFWLVRVAGSKQCGRFLYCWWQVRIVPDGIIRHRAFICVGHALLMASTGSYRQGKHGFFATAPSIAVRRVVGSTLRSLNMKLICEVSRMSLACGCSKHVTLLVSWRMYRCKPTSWYQHEASTLKSLSVCRSIKTWQLPR